AGRCRSASPIPAIRRRTRARRGPRIAARSTPARSSCRRSKPSGAGHAATSISIRPCSRTAYGHRTIRSPPPARRPTGSPMTGARPRKKTTREKPREPRNDSRPTRRSALHIAPADAALADGGLHTGHAVHRRRDGVHGRAELSDAGQYSQAARDPDPDSRIDPPRRAFAFRRPSPARGFARTDEARGVSFALCALRADVRAAADRLGDAVGRRLPGGFVAGRVAATDRATKREPAYGAVERAFLSRLPLFRADPDASRRGLVPRADSARRRLRFDGVSVEACGERSCGVILWASAPAPAKSELDPPCCPASLSSATAKRNGAQAAGTPAAPTFR